MIRVAMDSRRARAAQRCCSGASRHLPHATRRFHKRCCTATATRTIFTGRRTVPASPRSEEHTSELQSLMRSSYAVFCLKKRKTHYHAASTHISTKYNTKTVITIIITVHLTIREQDVII